MILYHYTALLHLRTIAQDGMIRTTESNVGSGRVDWQPFGEHVGPDVVWLTTTQDPTKGQGLQGPADKTAARIIVDVNDAAPWSRWCVAHGINPSWRGALEARQLPDQWYVVERPVARGEWAGLEVAEESRVAPTKRTASGPRRQMRWVPFIAATTLTGPSSHKEE